MTWRERVIEAQQTGSFTEEDKRLAAHFSTCAVEEHRQAHPEVVQYLCKSVIQSDGRPAPAVVPDDGILNDLGIDFYWAVKSTKPAYSAKILDAIEDRVLELKRAHA